MAVATAPAAEALYQVMPEMSAEDYGRLKESINEYYSLHGTPFWPGGEPVVDETGRVLDGHHRLKVCAELGIDAPTRQIENWDDEQKWSYAYSANLARRHLTREQRQRLIEAYLRRHPEDSDRHIGRVSGVHHETVGARRAELEDTGEIRQTIRPHQRPREEPDPLDHPMDVLGYDEYGTPLGWVEKETAEHLYTVQFVGRLIFKVPSDKTRMRGDKEGMPRESVESEAARTPISLTWTVAERDAGWEGLLRVANQIRQAIVSDPIIRRDWPRIPRHGERE